jgi:hypothetical protein
MPTDPPDDPLAKLDTQRCDTRALDAGALRAIQAAYASGAEHAAGGDVALAPLATAPANDATAPPGTSTGPDTIVELALGERDDDHRSRWASERAPNPIDLTALPSAHAGRPREAATLEVDYSPTARMQRARAARVQRTARAVTILCLAAGATLGVWAALRSDSDRPPLPGEQPASVSAALTLPLASATPTAAAPAPPDLPLPSSPSSAEPESTVPTKPTSPTPPPPASDTPPVPRPLLAAPVPAPVAATPTRSVGLGATAAPSSLPSGTVPPPPGGTVALPLPD